MTKKKVVIEDLTVEQDAQLDAYAERWTKIGLTPEPINHARAEEAVRACYAADSLPPPGRIEWLRSPFEMCVRGAELEHVQRAVDRGEDPDAAIKAAAELFRTDRTLPEEAQQAVRDIRSSCCYGQHDANWLGFYDFMRNVVDLREETEDVRALMDMAREGHWWLPFENICLASERPLEIYIVNEQLHRDGGPAMRYADGFSLWMLNGVEVPEWLVMTSVEKLDPVKIMKLANAEQRKEGIRKIGIERMKDPLKVQVIHSWKDYELWTFEFEGRRIGPYLKMVNDSTGQIHVEGVGEATGGVDKKIKTCQEALAWRGGMEAFSEPGWTA